MSHRIAITTLVLAFVPGWAAAATIDLNNLDWSVQYLIDQSQTVLGVNQFSQPRNNRGLAISPDGNYLYAGYNNPSSGFAVRKIDLNEPDYNDATLVHLGSASRGKAIATDDQGRVYLADATSIKVYDANLSSLQFTYSVGGAALEGVAVERIGGQLALFSSNRNTGGLSKLLLTELGGNVTGAALDGTFGTGGVAALSTDIRGVEVDSSGRIWVADFNDNRVYVVASDGDTFSTVNGITSPMDIGFDADVALITQSTNRMISSIDVSTLLPTGADFTAPLASLELTGTPATGGPGAFEGIVVVPGQGFWVAGGGINTLGEKSTYGRIDAQSGFVGPNFYTDTTHDDNDAILFAATIPEPSTLVLSAIGVLGFMVYIARRRRRR